MPKQSAQHEAPRAWMRSHQPDTAVKIFVLDYQSFSALQMEHMYEERLLDKESHRYAAWPDQWKSRQASKQNAYKEFVDAFGSETKSRKKNIPPILHTHAPAGKNNVKLMRKEIEQCLQNSNPLQSSLLNTPGHEISLSKLGFPTSKRQRKEGFAHGTGAPANQDSKKFTQNGKAKVNKREKKKKFPLGMSIETSQSKVMMNAGSHSKRRLHDDNSSVSSLKKHKN